MEQERSFRNRLKPKSKQLSSLENGGWFLSRIMSGVKNHPLISAIVSTTTMLLSTPNCGWFGGEDCPPELVGESFRNVYVYWNKNEKQIEITGDYTGYPGDFEATLFEKLPDGTFDPRESVQGFDQEKETDQEGRQIEADWSLEYQLPAAFQDPVQYHLQMSVDTEGDCATGDENDAPEIQEGHDFVLNADGSIVEQEKTQ